MQSIAPTPLTTEEALRTSSYLRELSAQFPGIAVAVQSIFGRCCIASACNLGLGELGAEAADLGNRILRCHEPDRLDLDPLLLIGIHHMLRDSDKSVTVLHNLLDRITLSLVAQPAETQRAGRVRNISAQLASLGFSIRPAKASKEMARFVDSPDRWFGCSVAQLADIAHHLVADDEALDEISTRILSLLALAELRNYRVDLGCTLLRTVFALGVPSFESTEALNFIALQRRRDGRYGFPNQFAEGTASNSNPHLSVFLPLTVNAVWLFRTEAQHRQRLQFAVSA